jgi:hypothetical protein
MTMRGTSVARKTPMTASSMRVVLWESPGLPRGGAPRRRARLPAGGGLEN